MLCTGAWARPDVKVKRSVNSRGAIKALCKDGNSDACDNLAGSDAGFGAVKFESCGGLETICVAADCCSATSMVGKMPRQQLPDYPQ